MQLSPLQAPGRHAQARHRGEDPRGAGRPRHLLPRRRQHRLRRRRQPVPVHGRRHEPVRLGRLRADRRARRTATRRSTPSAAPATPTTCAASCCASRPKDGGGYTIPQGNLFKQGTASTQPEIYAMGLRNPFRFEVNRTTGVRLRRRLLAGRRRGRTRCAGRPGTGAGWLVDKPATTAGRTASTPTLPYIDYDFATKTSGAAVQLRTRRSTTRRTTPA